AARLSVITIGFTMNIIVTPAVRALRHQYPDADVRSQYLEWDEPRAALLEHRVDAAVTRLPLPTDHLDVTVLYDEPRVLVVPRDHRLAGKESVTLDDIADEPLPRSLDPAWNAFWRVDPRPDGRPAPDGPLIKAVEDKIELVADGQAVAIIPASAPISSVRPDLTTVPLEGVEPGHVVLATRAGDRDRLVAAFSRCARSHLAGPGSQRARPGAAAGGPGLPLTPARAGDEHLGDHDRQRSHQGVEGIRSPGRGIACRLPGGVGTGQG
ncbi:MAG: LysR family substrate-binding domain-containing protein, partial [Trebonia sp.]